MKYYCKNKKNQNKTQTNGPNRMKLKLYFYRNQEKQNIIQAK